eukprot:4535779-Alexandrium_andersonii.AAC.1
MSCSNGCQAEPEAIMSKVTLGTHDYCYSCQQDCDVRQHMAGKLSDDELCCNAAGSTCTPWLAFGNRSNHSSEIM